MFFGVWHGSTPFLLRRGQIKSNTPYTPIIAEHGVFVKAKPQDSAHEIRNKSVRYAADPAAPGEKRTVPAGRTSCKTKIVRGLP
jgi:hypothetical protein